MVVVSGSLSGSWLKNVATYPSPVITSSDIIAPLQPTMSAKVVLVPRPNSHPFQERNLSLEQPVKVGRSVARARALSSNAIFDCKVLSRHHALLWFENGKFFLQDTKSSNGTFVNNNRLSGSESDPHEVFSGDIVQFGVEVVENNRKVTHGCIIATLKLFLPDGKEAKASPSQLGGRADLDELYRLNQYIQEAMQREQWLENKLNSLQSVVEQARLATEESWQAYVGEERLLSRVAALEAQQGGKTWGDERLREELAKLQDERGEYQEAAKEALRKLHAERLEAVAAAASQQRARTTAEQEANLAKDQLVQTQQELQHIAQKLAMEQQRAEEERALLEQRERELQERLEEEFKSKQDMQNKLDALSEKPIRELLPLDELEKCSLIYSQDMKSKEAFLGENESSENSESDNHVNGSFEQNHINLSVNANENNFTATDESVQQNDNTSNEEQTTERCRDSNVELQTSEQSRERSQDSDTNTIKLQYLTVQYENELRRQIDQLEQLSNGNRNTINELEKALASEKHISQIFEQEAEELRQELIVLRQQWKESCNEALQLRDKVLCLQEQLDQVTSKGAAAVIAAKTSENGSPANEDETQSEGTSGISRERKEGADEKSRLQLEQQHQDTQSATNLSSTASGASDSTSSPSSSSACSLSTEQIAALEEELVILKERYAQLNDEKLCLNKSYEAMREKYNAIVNQSNNTLFFYVAPLVLMVLYLLISSMFS